MKRSFRQTVVEAWRKLCWSAIHFGPRRDVTIDSSNGLLTVDSKDWLVGKYLYVKRSHETHEMEQVARLLQQERLVAQFPSNSVVMNVGANIGMTAIALVKNGFFTRALAFEPAPNTYRLLVKNIEQNGLHDRVQPFQMALSSADGEMDFELSPDNSGDNRVSVSKTPGFYHEELRRKIKVPARTLDGFLAENPFLSGEAISAVWVDIQGHEGHFLRGAKQFFRRGVPLVSEIWPYGIARSGMSAEEFAALVAEMFSDFYVLGIDPEQKRPIAEFSSVIQNYSGPREVCVVLFLPRLPS